MGVVAGSITVISTYSCKPKEEVKLTPIIQVDYKRIDELEMRLDAIQKMKCISVVADQMTLSVFPVERLGVVKVPPPTP
jgi:hypothetical protein